MDNKLSLYVNMSILYCVSFCFILYYNKPEALLKSSTYRVALNQTITGSPTVQSGHEGNTVANSGDSSLTSDVTDKRAPGLM